MRVIKIGYGRTSVHDFESSDYREYCYMEASLEDSEDIDQSLQSLRQRVCAEVGGVSEDIKLLQLQRESLEEEKLQLEAVVVDLRQRWNNLKEINSKVGEIEKGFNPLPF